MKQALRIYVLSITAILLFSSANAQIKYNDRVYTSDVEIHDTIYLNHHSPHRATFYSAVVPGLGQIYNKKYWKVPVLYAGFGGLIYFVGYNNFAYTKYKRAYEVKLRIESGENLKDEYSYLTKQSVLDLKDDWRRYRDLCVIGIGLLYVAQIIDANVDAHLFDYDVSEDLSLSIQPVIMEPFAYTNTRSSIPLGMRCSIRF